ncbi:MAG TPA: bifunctional DNA-formamidopyrimidine glycosylase/DNA-(apurinic or apyrimidinic site) lyase [Solirubrobacteraceae bacterium]|nr:bifunctional DNA-formamidopyrimidine glycosylase/DNA-(apurinic or apyrimidinic site) lyase [Solirubrobacteraceae bacterium]
MPELPEVETIRRQLAPLVEGRRLLRVEILDPRWSRPLTPDELADALRGRRVERLERRGKYLLWRLSDEVFLAQHLRMTGAVLCDPKPEPVHVGVRIELGAPGDRRHSDRRHDDRSQRPRASRSSRAPRSSAPRRLRLAIADPRRFGTGELLLGEEAMERFFAERLGLEPLDERFTAQHLRALARGRRAPVKAFLLDQRRVAGVGNIYADESLFRAGVHPLRPAGRLSLAQWERVREGVIEALNEGIDARGASIDDFRHIDGVRGSFQDRFLVHRRAGLPCPRCGHTIVKLVVGGRGTYVCERCQPRPRGGGQRRRPPRAPDQARPGYGA